MIPLLSSEKKKYSWGFNKTQPLKQIHKNKLITQTWEGTAKQSACVVFLTHFSVLDTP